MHQILGIMKKIFIAICALVLLQACNKDDDPQQEEKPGRTIFIYMAAENNLTQWGSVRYADEDLTEMKAGMKNIGNNNLVIYVDKAETTPPYMLCYRKGELADSISMPESLTSDPAILESMARKAFTEYPANSYGLVLWGHCNGWIVKSDSVKYTAMARSKSYGGDTGNNTTSSAGRSWMNIPSLAKALSHLPHLDFIFADCCNMMCVENAYELQNVTDYLIGSPAEIPAQGAPYNTIVPALFEKTTFWTSIVDRYFEQVTPTGNKVPLSVIKTSEITNLANATKTILKSMKAKHGDSLIFPDMSGLIYYYFTFEFSNINGEIFYDINDFMLKYAEAADYDSWKQAFDKAVVYKKMATTWDTDKKWVYYSRFTMKEEKFGGVSMYVPTLKQQSTQNKDIKQMGWYYAAGYNEIGW